MAAPRVVSLDYCADQYVLKLADPAQIAAISRGADKDYSYLRGASTPYKKIRPTLEETLPLEPDIIFRQWGGGANAENAFARFGARVVSLGYPENFDGVKANIRLVADALEHSARGETLIADLEAKLAAIPELENAPRALYVTPGGVTAGAHTMIDAIFSAGGVRNITAEEGKAYWPPLPAEALLTAPPELIVTGFFNARDVEINYWSAARHPTIEKQFRETKTVHLSADLVSCAGWHSAEAAEMIAAAVRAERNAH
ncbi:ABC transporter substrate-binding protein [Hyphococcus sp.]|uniref:ABC transporter substrate-binding protein n=1 Tax=Hyphococcus sp. TaxID=2038636 RepID=UPI003CCB92CE